MTVDTKLYQDAGLALGASDLIYVSRADGSADGKADLTALSAIVNGVNGALYAAASHTHVVADITDFPVLADVATSGAYADLTGAPSFATVATTGAYSDLSGKPTLATVATSGAYSDLTGKPTLFDGAFSSLTGKPTTLSGYGITDAQPLDGDLTALAALAGTNTIYYRSAANTWSAVTIGGGLSFTGGTLSTTRTTSMGLVIDGGGSAITTGIKGDLHIPVACTITAVDMLADQSGSIVIDIWKDTYANYPPTVADTITASAKPTISTALKSEDTTLTGWTVSCSAGDTLRFNVDSCTSITRVALSLKVTIS